jgi:hypothetical protein
MATTSLTTDILYDPDSFDASEPFAPPTEEDLSTFKQQVSEWTKIDDQVKKLSIAIRERRIHQRALSTKIQEFMIKYGYDNLTTQAGCIKSSVRQVKQPLKLSDIRSKILELHNLSGEELVAMIFSDENRSVCEKRSLRRIMPKVSMNIDI